MKSRRRTKPAVLAVAVGLFGTCSLGLTTGCTRAPAAAQSPESKDGHATVSVVKPERKTLRRVIKQPGNIEAFQETPVFAKIPGYVRRLHRDIGDPVKGPRYDAAGKLVGPGELLAELFVPELEEEVRQDEALVEQADAEVDQAKAAVDTALAQIDSAKALVKEAEAGRTRIQATYERWLSEDKRFDDPGLAKAVSPSSRDEIRLQLRSSDAARAEQEAKVDSTKALARESEAKLKKATADLKAAVSRVAVAKAKAGRSRALFEYSRIRAPFNGVVYRRVVNEDQFVQPATGAGAQPLFVVVQADRVRVFTKIPETDAAFVKAGMTARVQPLAIKDQDFAGTVTRTSWSLHPTERTVTAEIDLPNPDGRLRPGMYAPTVTLVAELPDRSTLPVSTVGGQGDQAFCFVVENGKLARTLLRVGLRDAAAVEVLKKATSPKPGEEPRWEDVTGNEAIVQGQLSGLTDGQPVDVK